jgi:pyruvate kinase
MMLTKLICTIGPASASRVHELVDVGMDVARLNFCHGTDAERRSASESVRQASRDIGRPVALLADLSGPKIRLGELDGGRMELREGIHFALGSAPVDWDGCWATTNYPRLAAELRAGDTVLLSDGTIELRVIGCHDQVMTEVVRGGVVHSRAGLNVPADRLSAPSLTEKDRADLNHAIDMGAELIAQSFVRRANDVRQLREAIGQHQLGLIAKVETRGAVEEVDQILEIADAIMIARGDLGAEIPFEEIPAIQRYLVDRALAAGKPFVVATEMLQSMVASLRPTRAEANDVASAVYDGAAGVLLSAETAIGANPVGAARAATQIIGAAERKAWDEREPQWLERPPLKRNPPLPMPQVALAQ